MRVIPRRGRTDGERTGSMSLMEHLEELRRRLIICVIALGAGSLPSWYLYEPLKDLLQKPYCTFLSENPSFRPFEGPCALYISGPIEGFTLKLKIVLYLGLVLALPVVLYQLWMFIVPGLTNRERRYAFPFIASALILFAGGAIFAYYSMPRGLSFLLGFAGEGVVPLLSFDRYVSFVVLVILAFGVSFLLPVLLVFLEMVGVLTPQRLASWRRWAFLGIFVFAAAITPTGDPLTLFTLAVPMYLFYEAAILIGRLLRRQKA